MTEVKLYQVGGSVRDELLGFHSKDIDFAVEAESFEQMRNFLVERGFEIFVETPQYFTIRARFPKDGSFSFGNLETKGLTVDFALCRHDGLYSDHRRPDSVEVGTIFSDLKRRDFTVNAIAVGVDGSRVDPHNGMADLVQLRLRTVGDPLERFTEDPLRILRALRFSVTRDMWFAADLKNTLYSPAVPEMLQLVSEERVREELHKMFKNDTAASMRLFECFPALRDGIFDGFNIWLEPTTAKR